MAGMAGMSGMDMGSSSGSSGGGGGGTQELSSVASAGGSGSASASGNMSDACYADPLADTCANFTRSDAEWTADLQLLCTAQPALPACTLWELCTVSLGGLLRAT